MKRGMNIFREETGFKQSRKQREHYRRRLSSWRRLILRMCFLFHWLFFLLLLIYCLNYYGSRIKFNFWCLKSNFVALFFPSKFLSYFHLIKLCHCYSNILNKCIWWTFEQPRFEWHRSTYVWIFSSFPVKSFIVFTGLMVWERPRWLKSCLQGEPQAEALALRGDARRPLKAC